MARGIISNRDILYYSRRKKEVIIQYKYDKKYHKRKFHAKDQDVLVPTCCMNVGAERKCCSTVQHDVGGMILWELAGINPFGFH